MSKDIDIGNGILVRLLYYPNARHAIVESIKHLSDPEYQQREWTKGPQERFSTAMPYIVIELLESNLDHLDVCMQKIDIFFYDEEEACLVQDLSYFLDEMEYDMSEDLGDTDIEHMNHPKWPQLVAKAVIAYELMKANNEKYNFIEHDDGYWEQKHRDEYRDWQEKFSLERGQDI